MCGATLKYLPQRLSIHSVSILVAAKHAKSKGKLNAICVAFPAGNATRELFSSSNSLGSLQAFGLKNALGQQTHVKRRL